MPRNANQGKNTNYSLSSSATNNAINFNYTDEFMSGQNPWTLSLWILWTSQPVTYKAYFFKGQSTSRSLVALYGDGAAIKFMCQGDDFHIPTFQTPSSVTVNKWYNLVVTYDGNLTIKAYVDNTLDATHTLGSPLDIGGGSKTNYFQLFQYNGSTIYGPSNARLSDLSIFDYELSPSQITTLYGDSTNGPGNPMALPSPPKTYYPLGTSAWNGNFLSENNAIGDYVFDFNSTNTFINVGSLNNFISNNVTISLWANFDTLPNGYDGNLLISTQGNSWDEGLGFVNNGSSGNMRFFIQDWNNNPSGNGGFVDSTTTITINKWFNFVGTWDGTTVKYYINGDLQGSSTYTGSITTTNNLIIGTSYNPIYGIDGKMSNVQIFNTALSATDVETLYNYGSPIRTLANIPQSSNLKAWYKLDASEVYNSTTTEWEVYNNAGYEKTYSFNGSNNIQIPNDSSIQPTNWTIGFWVKGFGQNGTYLFNNSPNGWNIKSSGNDIIISVGTSQSTAHRTATNALNGKWNYIVFSYDGANVRGSLNGGYLGYNGAYGQTYDSSNLFIGSYSDGTNGFVGEIGQILFWNTRKNNAEGWNSTTQKPITSLPAPPSSDNNNLVSWWKLDAATITDSFGSNTGINNGAILSDTIIGRPTVIGDGDSSGMNQSNLVQSDLQTVAPYSKYAMNFDGTDYINCNTSLNGINSITYSAWIKPQAPPGSFANIISSGNYQANERMLALGIRASNQKIFVYGGQGQGIQDFPFVVSYGTWYHVAIVYTNNQDVDLYVNGNAEGSIQFTNTTSIASGSPTRIGAYSGTLQNYFNGIISNVSIWNAALTQTQIREIYNEGLPSDLNSHSAYSNLLSWWQLGENSSYISGATNPWTFADEIGTNNATSGNLPETALTNGVGTTANGLSSGMSEGSLVGDAPYSTANAISSGMAVTAKGTDVP